MSDLSIRRVSIAEHAEIAARRFVETGEPQHNPHEGVLGDAQAWRSAYERYLLLHSVPEGEASA